MAGAFQRGPGETAKRCARGSQSTRARFTGLLLRHAIAISMAGRGAWRDNVFPARHLAGDVERPWRPVKHEGVCLRACGSVGEARASVGRHLAFHNRKRPHSRLDARTPDQACFGRLPQSAAA